MLADPVSECACEKQEILVAYFGRTDGPWWVCSTCDGLVRPIVARESLMMSTIADQAWKNYQAAKAAAGDFTDVERGEDDV